MLSYEQVDVRNGSNSEVRAAGPDVSFAPKIGHTGE